MLSREVSHLGSVSLLAFWVVHPELMGCWGSERKFLVAKGFCVGDTNPYESLV